MMTCSGSSSAGERLRRRPAEPAFAAVSRGGRNRRNGGYPVACTVAVAQSVEPLVVVQVVVGSSPIRHLRLSPRGRAWPDLAHSGETTELPARSHAPKARLRAAGSWVRVPSATSDLRFAQAQSGLEPGYPAAHGPVAQRIERRTSNPCAEVRLLPGPPLRTPCKDAETDRSPSQAERGAGGRFGEESGKNSLLRFQDPPLGGRRLGLLAEVQRHRDVKGYRGAAALVPLKLRLPCPCQSRGAVSPRPPLCDFLRRMGFSRSALFVRSADRPTP